jgi:hypothetical protein
MISKELVKIPRATPPAKNKSNQKPELSSGPLNKIKLTPIV